MRTSTGSISVTKIIQKPACRNGKAEEDDGKAEMIEIAILPTAMPMATTNELKNSRPRLPFVQATAAFSMNSVPGSHGGGTVSTSLAVCEPTTKAK
jgi:hypothetical protein